MLICGCRTVQYSSMLQPKFQTARRISPGGPAVAASNPHSQPCYASRPSSEAPSLPPTLRCAGLITPQRSRLGGLLSLSRNGVVAASPPSFAAADVRNHFPEPDCICRRLLIPSCPFAPPTRKGPAADSSARSEWSRWFLDATPEPPSQEMRLRAAGCCRRRRADAHPHTHTHTVSLPVSLTHKLPHTLLPSVRPSVSPCEKSEKFHPMQLSSSHPTAVPTLFTSWFRR